MGKIQNKFGYCYFSFEKDKIGGYVHIYDLYVYQIFRRQGHAKQILLKAKTKIKKTGFKNKIKIVAIPREKSIPKQKLISFYESLGLEVFSCYK